MTRTSGFVLVNALVLVAALSAAALLLLSRAEGTRVRAAAALQSQQIALFLDAGEALAITQLEADRTSGPTDHLGEPWARSADKIELDNNLLGGTISTQVTDMQGRFNLNWLADPQNIAARTAFLALCSRLAVATQHADAIILSLSTSATAPPPANIQTDPVGGPVLLVEQLKDISSISAQTYTRLAPYITALPSDTALNVNTASTEVLAAMLPNANAAALDGLVQSARTRPFTSVEAFMAALVGVIPPAVRADLDPTRFAIGSSWFQTEITVAWQGRIAQRSTTLERLTLSQGTKVAYRLDNWN